MYFKKKVNGRRTLSGDTQDWSISDGEKRTLLRVGRTWYASDYNYDVLEKMLLNETVLDLDELGFEPIQQPQALQSGSFDIAQTIEQAGNSLLKALESIIPGSPAQSSVTVDGEPVAESGVDGLGTYTQPSENPFMPKLSGDEIS